MKSCLCITLIAIIYIEAYLGKKYHIKGPIKCDQL